MEMYYSREKPNPFTRISIFSLFQEKELKQNLTYQCHDLVKR